MAPLDVGPARIKDVADLDMNRASDAWECLRVRDAKVLPDTAGFACLSITAF